MPPTQVEPDNGHEALKRIIDGGHRKEGFGVCHEAIRNLISLSHIDRQKIWETDLVILSSMDRGSRMKVGRTTRLKSAPGRNWEMMCESTRTVSITHSLEYREYRVDIPFP